MMIQAWQKLFEIVHLLWVLCGGERVRWVVRGASGGERGASAQTMTDCETGENPKKDPLLWTPNEMYFAQPLHFEIMAAFP